MKTLHARRRPVVRFTLADRVIAVSPNSMLGFAAKWAQAVKGPRG